jgi:hypothetical protein
MALSPRERNITLCVALAAMVLAIDFFALQPYLDQRADLVQQRRDKWQALNDARDLLNREHGFHQRLAGMSAALNTDPSAAEGRLLHLLHDWEQQASLSNAAFGRVRSADAHGLTRLNFAVSATGAMAGVASLIHHVETAPMPLRIDALRVTSAADTGDSLRVDLDISTLCQASVARPVGSNALPTGEAVSMSGGSGGAP